MGESLTQLCSQIDAASEVARDACHRHDWDTAREAARVVLSAGSKLHARLAMLSELRVEGFSAAEVDRAVARAQAQGPQPIPGDQPLPGTAPPKGGKPKGGGTRKG